MSLTAWTWDPGVALGLALVAACYARGWRQRARRSRQPRSRWTGAAFNAGLLFIAIALLSPIGTYDQQSFALHMLQHMLLIVVAAPLLLLGDPMLTLLWGLPDAERRGLARLLRPTSWLHPVGGVFGHPVVACATFLIVLGAWHVPTLYDAAQGRTPLHDLEHALFFWTAILFWWPVIHPSGGRRRLSLLAGIVYLVPAIAEGTLIGALLTFAPQSLYVTYRTSAGLGGLSPLEDQQLAGLIMWVPSGLVYLGGMLALLALTLRDPC